MSSGVCETPGFSRRCLAVNGLNAPVEKGTLSHVYPGSVTKKITENYILRCSIISTSMLFKAMQVLWEDAKESEHKAHYQCFSFSFLKMPFRLHFSLRQQITHSTKPLAWSGRSDSDEKRY